jgi:two-component system sensor histidine kinase UhpB
LSLRFRLNCILFLTIALAAAGGTILVVFNARQSVRSEVESTVNLAIQLIRTEIAGERRERLDSGNWLRQLSSLGRSRHLQIEIRPRLENSAKVAGKSVSDSRLVHNVPLWFAWSVTPEPLSFHQIVRLADGRDTEILIRADPSDELVEAWNEALDFFGLIAVMAAIVLVLVTITVERAFRPVSLILDGLDRLENGLYHEPLPEFPLPEFRRIADAINQAATALESARQDNHALRRHSLEVREQERQRLARELHDEFGQSLSAIKVVAVSLKNQTADSGPLTGVGSILTTCDHLFAVLRSMLRRLHPLVLDELGLKAALDDMLEVCMVQRPPMILDYRCDPAVDGFPPKLQIHVFRIVQECMTNIAKHARAGRVSVEIRVDPRSGGSASDSSLRIEVCDDGRGFDPKAVRSGFGLRGIRERVAGLGGETSIRTAPGQGVRIEIDIPFARSGQCSGK